MLKKYHFSITTGQTNDMWHRPAWALTELVVYNSQTADGKSFGVTIL
jgi:hypothetical protein